MWSKEMLIKGKGEVGGSYICFVPSFRLVGFAVTFQGLSSWQGPWKFSSVIRGWSRDDSNQSRRTKLNATYEATVHKGIVIGLKQRTSGLIGRFESPRGFKSLKLSSVHMWLKRMSRIQQAAFVLCLCRETTKPRTVSSYDWLLGSTHPIRDMYVARCSLQ